MYPPAYAEALTTTYDELELRCALEAPPDAILAARLRFLIAAGERHQAQERAIELSGAMVGALAQTPARKQCSVGPDGGAPPLTVGVELTARPLGEHRWEVCFRVENRTLVSSGLDRAGALARSLISTHPVVHVTGGRFVSPLEQPCPSVNTFPVLATPHDDVVIGAAIVLPDHPEIAPESRGGLFDSTEIEEALLLHEFNYTIDTKDDLDNDGKTTDTLEVTIGVVPRDKIELDNYRGFVVDAAGVFAGVSDAGTAATLTRNEKNFSTYLTLFTQYLYDRPTDNRFTYFTLTPASPANGRSVNRIVFKKENIKIRTF